VRFHLRVSSRFLATPESVWALKTDPENLREEFLPWLRLSVDDLESLRSALKGEELPRTIDARIWAVLAWPIQLTEYEEGASYCDRSQNAVFEEWEHHHVLQPASDAVRYLDAVTFTSRIGPPWLVARLVEALFVHRHRRAARKLPTDARATGVSILRELMEVSSDGTEGFL